MNDKDILQRFIFENVSVRGEIVHLNESFQTIMQQHDYPSIIRQLLGEVLVAASLLSATIKYQGRLTVQFQGKDKLKLLLAQCDSQFHLRGLAQWEGELNEAELPTLLKQGVLVITIDPESGGKRYQGIVEWQGNSIAQSIEGYFNNSEQLPTRLWMAVNDEQGAGLLLQAMPIASGTSKSKHGHTDHDWEHLMHLTGTVTRNELLTLDTQQLLRRLYHQEDVRLFPSMPVMFQCTCSIEKGENAILFLGQQEVEQELKEKQKLVVTCEFCNKEFTFDRVDVAKIFKKGNKPSSSTQIH